MPMNAKIRNSTLYLIIHFKGRLIRSLWKELLMMVLSTSALWFLDNYDIIDLSMNISLSGLMSAGLGLLLVFRNNTAYDRWWEARKVLGGLTNTSRNLAIQFDTYLSINQSKEKNELGDLLIAFGYALKEHLRGGVKMNEVAFLSQDLYQKVEEANHKPNRIANLLTQKVYDLHMAKSFTDFQQLQIQEKIMLLIDILGKCERIHKTPMPEAHNYLLKIYTFIYSVSMPFGLVSVMGWWAIPISAITFYVMISLVIIAEEIEDPFGDDPGDLPVDAMVKNIEGNVREILN